ncbi:hypothetical protein OROGR_002415 [Orobanche gracilis]
MRSGQTPRPPAADLWIRERLWRLFKSLTPALLTPNGDSPSINDAEQFLT